MRSHITVLMILLFIASPLAQPRSPDEEAIRALIAGQRNGVDVALTSDAIFWSGAYKRPIVRAWHWRRSPRTEAPCRARPGFTARGHHACPY